jgi:hypothetical protein
MRTFSRRGISALGGCGAAVLVGLVGLPLPVVSAHETDQYTLPLGREFADLRFYFSDFARAAITQGVSDTNIAIRGSLVDDRPTPETTRLQSPDYVAGTVWWALFNALLTNEGLDAELAGGAMQARFPGLVVVYRPEESIYDDPLLLVDVTKFVRTFFRASSVNVGGTVFGTDKFLHFIHLGRIYHSTYLSARGDGLSEDDAVARAVDVSAGSGLFLSENGFLGMVSTGIRSNADLAANYAGFKFYRNLTEPVRIGGRLLPPMLVMEGFYWRLAPGVRPGTDFFAAFVTPHFNEALNPNSYALLVDARVRAMLRARCADVLDWYRDERGRVRSRGQFSKVEVDLSTFDGEPYGYQSDGESRVSIATTCFEPVGASAVNKKSRASEPVPGAAQAAERSFPFFWPGSDGLGRTELWWAAREGRVDEVKRLIGEVENPNAPDADGESPLHAAARGGHAPVIELLIAYGADPNAKDRYGATPLHVSVENLHPQCSQLLLERGSDANAKDAFGRSPLHQAALTGDRGQASLLIGHGADTTALYAGRTPAQVAARGGHGSLSEWLTLNRAGAEVK